MKALQEFIIGMPARPRNAEVIPRKREVYGHADKTPEQKEAERLRLHKMYPNDPTFHKKEL